VIEVERGRDMNGVNALMAALGGKASPTGRASSPHGRIDSSVGGVRTLNSRSKRSSTIDGGSATIGNNSPDQLKMKRATSDGKSKQVLGEQGGVSGELGKAKTLTKSSSLNALATM
jgi:hypothetical protein